MIGYILMRYGLDADGKEISGAALCASKAYDKVHERLRKIYELESQTARDGDVIHDYDRQVVVEYGDWYEDENGVRYIIESVEIL